MTGVHARESSVHARVVKCLLPGGQVSTPGGQVSMLGDTVKKGTGTGGRGERRSGTETETGRARGEARRDGTRDSLLEGFPFIVLANSGIR